MEIIGFVASVLMGLSLGLIGSGGSILTVPILVYLFGVNPVLSTSYSLFVVGLTSLIGSYSHFKKGNLDLKTALIFGIPSIVSVYAVRKFIVPTIPDPFFSIGDFLVTKSIFVLIVFSVLMVMAALSMIRKNKREVLDCEQKISYKLPAHSRRRYLGWRDYRARRCRWWISDHSSARSFRRTVYEKSRRNFPIDHCIEITHWFYRRSWIRSST